MRILMSGASGLIGSALAVALRHDAHEVVRLVRSRQQVSADAVLWDPESVNFDRSGFERADAVVHLAGENIAQGRWTEARKQQILDSRIIGTAALCAAVSTLTRPPKAFLCASAVGFYGDRDDERLTEDSALGEGFLAEVCHLWEMAAAAAARRKMRLVNLRFGAVLSGTGGALAKMLPLFRFGLGGVLGGGRQYMSWVALDDAVAAIRHILANDSIAGPVNVVSPNPVTNREFTATLARVLSRPAILPVPAFALRLALGEMADPLLLSSARVEPARLLASGFEFRFSGLEAALRHALGK